MRKYAIIGYSTSEKRYITGSEKILIKFNSIEDKPNAYFFKNARVISKKGSEILDILYNEDKKEDQWKFKSERLYNRFYVFFYGKRHI